MSLYRQPKSPYWRVRFSVGGVKVRRSSGTTDRSAAEEFETRLRYGLWRQVKLGEKPRHTWAEAVSKWQAEAQNRGRDRDRQRLVWFAQYLDGLALADINREIIEKLRTLKARESSPSTANRHMALLRMLLRKAHREWDWIDKAPVVPMYRLERQEPRFLTQPQFARLLKALPPHLRKLAGFSVETGVRMRNATHLRWEQIDFKHRLMIVPASYAKAGRTISVPLSPRACSILRSLTPTESGPIFIWRGRPMDDANGSAFKSAASRAGVPWLRWHDLRHTWASWLVQRGVPLQAVMELGGWASLAMVQRYAHLDRTALRAYVEHGKGIPRTGKRARKA